jgi:hypothetical protein
MGGGGPRGSRTYVLYGVRYTGYTVGGESGGGVNEGLLYEVERDWGKGL